MTAVLFANATPLGTIPLMAQVCGAICNHLRMVALTRLESTAQPFILLMKDCQKVNEKLVFADWVSDTDGCLDPRLLWLDVLHMIPPCPDLLTDRSS